MKDQIITRSCQPPIRFFTFCLFWLILNPSGIKAQTVLYNDSSLIAWSNGKFTRLGDFGKSTIVVKKGNSIRNAKIREITQTIVVYQKEGTLHDFPIYRIARIEPAGSITHAMFFDENNTPLIRETNIAVYNSDGSIEVNKWYPGNTPVPLQNAPSAVIKLSTDTLKADTIVFNHGESVSARIVESSDSEILYRKADFPTGPLYTVRKSEINIIKFSDGTAVPLNQPVYPAIAEYSQVSYARGEKDAQEYYDGRDAFAGGVFCGLLFIIGWFAALVACVIPPTANPSLQNPNYPLLDKTSGRYNKEYAKGYRRTAHAKKAGKIVAGFFTGMLVCIAVLLLIITII